jgi:hypothetical protein
LRANPWPSLRDDSEKSSARGSEMGLSGFQRFLYFW